MKPTRLLLAAGTLLALTLGGCSPDAPDAAPNENNVAQEEAPPAVAPQPTPLALPTPAVPMPDVNASAEMEPEPVTPPDEQMLDDASATGMTARAARDQPVDATPATGENEQR